MPRYVIADRQWWVQFKRQYYGTAEQWPDVHIAATVEPNLDAPVLREGTCEQAGVDPALIEVLNSTMSEWTTRAESQGFTICIARHGVVFYHQPFGEHEGHAMTRDTQCPIHSISKLFTSVLTMMFVDRQHIALDEPIDRYLPPLRDIPVATPITTRMLLTHTSGLRGHHGDEILHLEEHVADQYAHMEIPVVHVYNGKGFAVTARILEHISGECYQRLIARALLDPLEIAHTTCHNSHNGIRSTALDLARLGQILLNGGAYGNRRLFSEQSRDAMVPARLTTVFGPDTSVFSGLGIRGLGNQFNTHHDPKHCYMSDASNSSGLLIMPKAGVVIAVASTDGRKNNGADAYDHLRQVIVNHITRWNRPTSD
jgi:CubicO group peptidase (beta-lactamase class C family)